MSDNLNVKEKDNIKICIPNKPEYVGVARLTTSAIANKVGFNVEEIDDIKVAVAEACTIIIDGNDNIDSIDIEYILEDNTITIFVRAMKGQICLDELGEKGLGLIIIKSLMEEVHIINRPEFGELKMTKRIEDVAR